VSACHEPTPLAASPVPIRQERTWLGLPGPAVVLAAALAAVGIGSSAVVAISPFDAATFGGLTVPTVLGAGVLDGLNPCAFALLVLFATYTLAMVNKVTASGDSTGAARRQLLAAGSLYVGAVWITYFLIGLGLFSFLSWMGQDHFATRIAAVLALLMGLWMLKDILFPRVGPALAAPHASHGWMQNAMERGGMGGMLLAGVLVGICTVPCSGAIYLGIVALLNASGGGTTGLALLALYNLAYIVPLVVLLAMVSNRRVLGRLGRWNRANSLWVKGTLAVIVIAMSLGLLITL
jgi:cytochrome c-type biogenesis protein